MSIWKRYGLLSALAVLCVIANGYHFATDDGSIYLPEIIYHLHPNLYPDNAIFFHAQGSRSLCLRFVGLLASISGGSAKWVVLLLQCAGIFAVLASGLRVAELLFQSKRASWASISLLACVLSVFVAGTSIPIMDPYFTSRTISTPLTLIALASAISGKRVQTALVLVIAFLVHPLMTIFAALFIGSFYLTGLRLRVPARVPVYASALPLSLGWGPVAEPAQQTLLTRSFFFASRWTWIEWTGVILPLILFFVLWRVPLKAGTVLLRRVCGAAFLTGIAATLFFLLINVSPNLESFVRLQPMRAFQLLYIVMFLVVGGLVGEYILRNHVWRWTVLLIALGLMDFAIDRATYPASSHLEWPTATTNNEWVQGFDWARTHTPEDALFALPPDYMHAEGEDMHGFRGIAERSSLADVSKDSAVVSMFPELAPEWKRQVDAQAGWDHFTPADFHRLAMQYRVSWVIVQTSKSAGLDCQYHNQAVAVCRVS